MYNLNKLDEAISELVTCSPFYGLWLIQSYKEYAGGIPTACLKLDTNTFRVSYHFNRTWYDGLTEIQREKILQHEVLHDCKGHLFWSGYDDKKIANLAMDIVINLLCITDSKGTENRNWLPEGAVYWDSFPEFNLEKNETEAYYYKKLMQKKQEKQDSGSSGNKDFDRIMDEDIEEGWKHNWEIAELSEEQKEIMKPMIEAKLREIAQQTEEMRGNVPSFIQQQLDIINKPAFIKWNKFFRQIMGSVFGEIKEATRRRPNKRIIDYAGSRYIPTINVLFMKDASGSMSDYDLEEANNELNWMSKCGVNIWTAQWDTECTEPVPYNNRLEHIRMKSGGTSASSAIKVANKSKGKYDFVIIFTDGYIESNPPKLLVPGMWLITKDGTKDIQHENRKIQINSRPEN